MREEATPWSSAALAAAAGITAAACWTIGETGGTGGHRRSDSVARENGNTRATRVDRQMPLHVLAALRDERGVAAGDRARVGAGTYPEERLLEERAALRGGGVLAEGRLTSIWCLAPNLPAAATIASPSLRSASGPAVREHGGDAGRRAGARDDARRRAGGAEVRRGHGGGHLDLDEGGTTRGSCVRLWRTRARRVATLPKAGVLERRERRNTEKWLRRRGRLRWRRLRGWPTRP